MRIGVLGGSFDPIHNGHLALARACLAGLGLDEVLFLPTRQNPLKRGGPGASEHQRMEMVLRAIASEPQMSASDIEISRPGPSYTVDTMEELHMAKHAEYWFLMGSDAAKHFPSWKNPGRIIKLCRLGVVVRDSATDADSIRRLPTDYQTAIDLVPMQTVPTSSSAVRDLIAQHRDVSAFVPPSVDSYIRDNRLYED